MYHEKFKITTIQNLNVHLHNSLCLQCLKLYFTLCISLQLIPVTKLLITYRPTWWRIKIRRLTSIFPEQLDMYTFTTIFPTVWLLTCSKYILYDINMILQDFLTVQMSHQKNIEFNWINKLFILFILFTFILFRK